MAQRANVFRANFNSHWLDCRWPTLPIPFDEIDSLIRHDPGGRGVAGHRVDGRTLCLGQLEAAARSLCNGTGAVGIVTGFCVSDAEPPASETDGPPGAIYLARALVALGRDVALISDEYTVSLLEVGCDDAGLPRSIVHCLPFEDHTSARASLEDDCNARTDAWIDEFLRQPTGARLSHLIALERIGPSHTSASLAAQPRRGPAPIELFEREVPPEDRNVCHSMRGRRINEYTAKTHRLFEVIAERRLPITTLGIGDGGNELGMGGIPWETLHAAIAIGPGGCVACRIATDCTLLAGVSNWGAYALAMAACGLAGRWDAVRDWDADRERALIERMVAEAGAVDGVTRRREATVDGLPEDEYLRIFRGLRTLCGLE